MVNNKVLVVEDELKIRNVVCMYLEKEGFNVLQTDNGVEALSMIEKEKPSLIILDIMLPGLSGLDVCKRIKTNEETKDTYIIILSAKGQEWEKAEGYQVGADLYETKPFSPKNLINKIKELLNNKLE
ncbi:MAG: response regulator [Candidatus Helarchaeota archaeon]|nr:response regulator [Candidatus Helarchaeota archaeon]